MRKSARLWRDQSLRALAEGAFARPGSPSHFHIDTALLFERRAPLEIELGAGKGEFIIERAAATPEHNFLAVELATSVLHLLALHVARSGLSNLKVLQADARTLVNLMLPHASAVAYHIYFPDPWPKERHAKHRLFSPYFVTNLARTLTPDGIAYFASDVRDYAEVVYRMLDENGFRNCEVMVPGAHRSNFGRKYAAEGRPVFAGAFRIGQSRALTLDR
ncbi:MAG TPA: tRNA (guanosine(46)-N7)-methyltransferase TrmB [Candidatus Binataceae bacterium]|nr:tRNA (guanosine(46)-N7)-methyltransferase TrmB [Candidatus Binataceae bacterium]